VKGRGKKGSQKGEKEEWEGDVKGRGGFTEGTGLGWHHEEKSYSQKEYRILKTALSGTKNGNANAIEHKATCH